MRLIVARCQVSYAGRLSTVLPEAVRLLMVKADGTFMVWADGGGSSVKPLNWMFAPTVIEEELDEDGALQRLLVRKRSQEDRLEIAVAEVLSTSITSSTRRQRSRRRGSSANCRSCWPAPPSGAGRG